MRISEKWLREWVNPDITTDALAAQLTMAGLEVDAIETFGDDLNGGTSYNYFGWSVSLSDDGYTLAVSHINLSPAIVKVYRFSDGSWIKIGGDIDGVTNDSQLFGVSTYHLPRCKQQTLLEFLYI